MLLEKVLFERERLAASCFGETYSMYREMGAFQSWDIALELKFEPDILRARTLVSKTPWIGPSLDKTWSLCELSAQTL